MSVTIVRVALKNHAVGELVSLETDECLSTVSLDKQVVILSIAGPTS
ncbi:hypothetical protein AWB77_03621 [Caballeronia fortuita]|uniref:Uncharacterized protein n=1 Tax=Caballeronia fortuita TaxID=1777138 RepID=A0A158C4R0_9BURK|nr:hypothetical protein [Caballeronia fortuita]SAK77283.1 hypothetical protein AWB77_03621 [Caballeronia fortuita]